MATQVPNVNKVSSGLCPHGLPPGACPICSKMGGGGGSLRAGERPQKAGEMSYHECVMMGNLIRSRELAQKRHIQNLELRAENFKQFVEVMNKTTQALKDFIAQNSTKTFFKPVVFIAEKLALPILNIISNLPQVFPKLQNFKFDIQDKLNAVFGEMKNFIQKKLADIVSAFKINLEGLFKILKRHHTKDDDTKIDDDKRIFNLKTILHKILRKKKQKDEPNSQN